MSQPTKSRKPVLNIHARRLLKGRTLREVATKAGITESALGRIFRGERQPRLDTSVKVAKALKTSLEALYEALP